LYFIYPSLLIMVDDKTEELNYGDVLKDLQSGNPQDIKVKLKSSKFDMDTQDENGFNRVNNRKNYSL
jgi:hypothetical protein